MQSKISNAKLTFSKYNSNPAIRLDFETSKGKLAKTININDSERSQFVRLLKQLGVSFSWDNIQQLPDKLQGKTIDIDVKRSERNPRWLDVEI